MQAHRPEGRILIAPPVRSAVCMAARVSNTVGQKNNPLQLPAGCTPWGPNVAGVIGSAIAAGSPAVRVRLIVIASQPCRSKSSGTVFAAADCIPNRAVLHFAYQSVVKGEKPYALHPHQKENIDFRAHLLRHVGQQSVAKKAWAKRAVRGGARFFTAAKNGESASSSTSRRRTRGSPSTRRGIFTRLPVGIAGSMKGAWGIPPTCWASASGTPSAGAAGDMHPSVEGRKGEFLSDPKHLASQGLYRRGHSGLCDHPHVSAADAVGGKPTFR